jgi:diguanylate cyclase (GGDEF)-like protein
VATFADISALKATETRLEALSTLDPLTGLPNRRALHTRLGQALARAQLNQSQGAVMFLDLDRFKVVNDTLGHAAGDHLLRVLSHRFRARLREHDVIARMGGDEFVVVLDDLADLAQATRVAGELLAEVAKPVPIGAHREVTVGTSIGISVFPGDGLTVDELIRKADAALYLAKGARDGSYRYFHAAMTLTTAPEDDL